MKCGFVRLIYNMVYFMKITFSKLFLKRIVEIKIQITHYNYPPNKYGYNL